MSARLPKTPWRVFERGATVSIFDAGDREIIHWKGFDSSKVTGTGNRSRLAHLIVDSVNGRPEACEVCGGGIGGALGFIGGFAEENQALSEAQRDRVAGLVGRLAMLLAGHEPRVPDGELEGCPFCGAEPYLHEPDFKGDHYQIGCNASDCCGEDGDGPRSVWVDGDTFEEARERWHQRVRPGRAPKHPEPVGTGGPVDWEGAEFAEDAETGRTLLTVPVRLDADDEMGQTELLAVLIGWLRYAAPAEERQGFDRPPIGA